MDLFDIGQLEQSALDNFLTDANLREKILGESDQTALQELLAERSRPIATPKKKEALPFTTDEKNAPVRISVSPDETKAWVVLDPSLQGTPASQIETKIHHGLVQQKITYGIRRQQITRLSKNLIFGKPLLIAEGKLPQEGKEGAVHFNFDTNLCIKPKSAGDYSVDPIKPDFVPVVKAGSLLCTSSKTTNDFTGRSIRGRLIYPQNGGVDSLRMGENVHASSDGRRWYSVSDGEVVFRKGVLSVFPVLRLEQVDANSGNVKYDGSIYIKERIEEGYTVEATGNIVVGGVVNNCTIKAGGHFVAGGGINGGESSSFTVGGSLRTPFMEFVNATVEEDVYTDVILGGKITCQGGIFVAGKRGRITGAHCMAREIFAEELGNQAGAKTTLEITPIKVLDEQIYTMQQELESWRTREGSMRKILSETESRVRRQTLERLHTQVIDQVHQLEERLISLQWHADIVRTRYSFEIRSTGSLHPKVCCIINGSALNNEKIFYNSRVCLRDGRIQIGSFRGAGTPV